jgi:hypothetical protein
MANTIIQIKRSQSTALPPSLQYGELAYSFQSGKLFLGDNLGNAIAIGGNTYNQIIDSATSLNTSNALVKRNASGDFAASAITASLYGNANTASRWATARTFGLDGDVSGQTSIDGSANANTTVTLKDVNSNVGTWGGVTNIPVFTVNSKGLVTAASNVAVSTALSIAGDSGSDSISLLNDTLTFVGGDGITSAVTANTASFAVDATVLRTTGDQSKTGNFTIIGNLNVSGNTSFTGNTSYIDIEHYSVTDPLIYLAANNYYSDIVAIGFAGNYFDGTNELHTGLFRAPQSNTYYLFTGVTDELSANNEISPSSNGFTTATLVSNIEQGRVSNLTAAISVTDGGTGLRQVATGDILYANNTNSLTRLAAVSQGNVIISGTTPSYGKVGLTTHIEGILGISNGGTNSIATPSAGAIAYGNGSSYLFNTPGTSGQSVISGGTGAPTFGTLDLRGGGLGFTTANTNSVTYYSGSGNLMSSTNTPSDGYVLQYATTAGVHFGGLDGGNF